MARRYTVQARERRFLVRITSDIAGYAVRLLEETDGPEVERMKAVDLIAPPRLEIEPSQFYRDRRGHLVELIRLVNTELYGWRVSERPEGSSIDSDAYIRANLHGWPEGYPNAVDDDLENLDRDWHQYGCPPEDRPGRPKAVALTQNLHAVSEDADGTIVVSVMFGSSIARAAQEMVDLAKARGVKVRCDCHGVTLTADAETVPADLAQTWLSVVKGRYAVPGSGDSGSGSASSGASQQGSSGG